MIVFLFSLGESMQLAITTEYTLVVDGISQIDMLLYQQYFPVTVATFSHSRHAANIIKCGRYA